MRENDVVFMLIFKIVNEMPSVGKIETLQRQRSARRDKSSGPLPFLFDVLHFCIFKIHFPSRFCPDMPLSFSFATILPPEPPYCFSRSTFLHRYKYEFTSFGSDPIRYGLEKLLFITFLSLSRQIRTLLTSFIVKISCQDFSSRFFVGVRGSS